ncbi:hypothetical protein FB451DRAFT_1185157 [Mycena latifolia]|nr:hypothetical protein FB451DRAFT_1185157 [Mycena latifolia]
MSDTVGSDVQQSLRAPDSSESSPSALGSLSSTSWTRRTMFPSKNIGQSVYGPAIATDVGGLWISGVMGNRTLWYTSGNNTVFAQTTTKVNSETAAAGPALADFAGVLHLVFPDTVSGKLVHLQDNDTTGTRAGACVHGLVSEEPVVRGTVGSDGRLELVLRPRGGPLSWGTPALYALGSQIYILFPANKPSRQAQVMSATAVNGTWISVTAPNHSTAYGTSAASYETTSCLDLSYEFVDGASQWESLLVAAVHPCICPLSQILGKIYAWLQGSATEGLVLSIPQESDPDHSTVTFDAVVSQHIQQQSQFWNTGATMPQLQDIRGKMQLARRYNAAISIGIDATPEKWADNNGSFTIPLPHNAALAIDDHYNYDGVVGLEAVVLDKTSYVAADANILNWYISLSSASNTPFNQPETLAVCGTTVIPPIHFVDGINQMIITYLNAFLVLPAPYPRVETIMMDFPDTPDGGGLIEAIVALNG